MKLELDVPADPTPHQLMAALAMADPNPYRRWEVIGDHLSVLPNPANRHEDAADTILEMVRPVYRRRPPAPEDGWVILSTPDLKDISDRNGIKRPKIPAIGGWRAKRYVLNEAGYGSVAPDWVCEVHSPSTKKRDRGPKARDYADLGIEWYWLVDLDAARLDVWRLEGGDYTSHAAHDLRRAFSADPFQEAGFAADDFFFIVGDGE